MDAWVPHKQPKKTVHTLFANVKILRLVPTVTYTMLRTIQRPELCSAVHGIVSYKEPLESFDKSKE